MPAWLFGGTRQRTKRLEKSASEGNTRIDDSSGGSPLTIKIGAEFPIGINTYLDMAGMVQPSGRSVSVGHHPQPG